MTGRTADLLILGSGPHALEIFDIALRTNLRAPTWNVVGFVAANPAVLPQSLHGLPVLSLSDALAHHPAARLVPEFEWPRKQDLPRDRLATLIDPTVFVASTSHIGLGCVIYPHCYVGAHAWIGDFLFCLADTVINHNDFIAEGVTLTSGVILAGDVRVEADCYLGQGCTVRELVTIGRGSLVGMGSVVLHDVPPNSVMAGNPARRLHARADARLATHIVRVAKRIARRGAEVVLRLVRAPRG